MAHGCWHTPHKLGGIVALQPEPGKLVATRWMSKQTPFVFKTLRNSTSTHSTSTTYGRVKWTRMHQSVVRLPARQVLSAQPSSFQNLQLHRRGDELQGRWWCSRVARSLAEDIQGLLKFATGFRSNSVKCAAQRPTWQIRTSSRCDVISARPSRSAQSQFDQTFFCH